MTSEFGMRNGQMHWGIDLITQGNPSAPVLAAAPGTVTHSEWNSSLGWYVVIRHNINNQVYATMYAHLRYQPSVRVGNTVTEGQRIGTKGNTGDSSSPHLHFEVHRGGFVTSPWGANAINPRPFLFPSGGSTW